MNEMPVSHLGKLLVLDIVLQLCLKVLFTKINTYSGKQELELS